MKTFNAKPTVSFAKSKGKKKDGKWTIIGHHISSAVTLSHDDGTIMMYDCVPGHIKTKEEIEDHYIVQIAPNDLDIVKDDIPAEGYDPPKEKQKPKKKREDAF